MVLSNLEEGSAGSQTASPGVSVETPAVAVAAAATAVCPLGNNALLSPLQNDPGAAAEDAAAAEPAAAEPAAEMAAHSQQQEEQQQEQMEEAVKAFLAGGPADSTGLAQGDGKLQAAIAARARRASHASLDNTQSPKPGGRYDLGGSALQYSMPPNEYAFRMKNVNDFFLYRQIKATQTGVGTQVQLLVDGIKSGDQFAVSGEDHVLLSVMGVGNKRTSSDLGGVVSAYSFIAISRTNLVPRGCLPMIVLVDPKIAGSPAHALVELNEEEKARVKELAVLVFNNPVRAIAHVHAAEEEAGSSGEVEEEDEDEDEEDAKGSLQPPARNLRTRSSSSKPAVVSSRPPAPVPSRPPAPVVIPSKKRAAPPCKPVGSY